MESLEVKFRLWYKGIPPRPIKLQIPGWAGDSHGHNNGDKPQPWHCTPFVDGSTYGLELIYPFDSECRVYRDEKEKLIFEGDFEKEAPWQIDKQEERCLPPFSSFAPGHYGFTSSMDIEPPEGYVLRLEPHPRFYTDITGTCPIPVAGHIQRWWSRIFFVAFKAPLNGETHIFRKGEPYAQILIVPDKVTYNMTEMTISEKMVRSKREEAISEKSKYIAKKTWKDHIGNQFDDKYLRLKSAYVKGGIDSVDEIINNTDNQKTKRRIKKKFFKKVRH